MSVVAEWNLYCLRCGREQPHRFVYAGVPEKGELYLKAAVCRECGNAVRMDRIAIVESYTRKMVERVVTKPFRMLKEAERDPLDFLLAWPFRVATKPLRVAREVYDILEEEPCA